MHFVCAALYASIVTMAAFIWFMTCVPQFVTPQRIMIRGRECAMVARKRFLP